MLPIAFWSFSVDCGFFKIHWKSARQDVLCDRVDAVLRSIRSQRGAWSQGAKDIAGLQMCWEGAESLLQTLLHCSRGAGAPPWLASTLALTGNLCWGCSTDAHACLNLRGCPAFSLKMRMWFLSLRHLLPSEIFTSTHFVTSVLCCALESFVPVSQCSNISIHSGICKYTRLQKIGVWYLEQLCSIQIMHLIRHEKVGKQH